MTAEGWEASALTAEKIAAGWLKMANERKVHDETKEYYFKECRRLMDMADFYRTRAPKFLGPQETAQ